LEACKLLLLLFQSTAMAMESDPQQLQWNIVMVLIGLAMAWMLLCLWLRSQRQRFLSSFSPQEDADYLMRIVTNVEFPYLSHTSMEFAIFRTCAIPSISKILDKTGVFRVAAAKRADDTEILTREFWLHHVDSDRGSLAIRRLNFIHSQYVISNDDYLYVLALFAREPVRWARRFGYRKWTSAEEVAGFVKWRDLGVRMGIKHIPENIQELERWEEEYEKKNMKYADSNRRVADAQFTLLLEKYPRCTHSLLRRAIYAMLDDRLRTGLGYPRQAEWIQRLVRGTLRFCVGTFVSLFLPPRPFLLAADRIKVDIKEQGEKFNPEMVRPLSFQRYSSCSYPNGYKIADLGAFKPGQLGTAVEGELLCPLSSRYFAMTWPPEQVYF
jgi:hypothetical protein